MIAGESANRPDAEYPCMELDYNDIGSHERLSLWSFVTRRLLKLNQSLFTFLADPAMRGIRDIHDFVKITCRKELRKQRLAKEIFWPFKFDSTCGD